MADDTSGSKKTLTMAEIAQRLSVSIATVSRVFNDQPGVSPEVRQRVLALSAEAGYAPHGGARGLATTQTHTVAFLTLHRSLPLDEDYFYQRIMLGAQQELARHGYYLLVSVIEPDQVNDLANLRLLAERRVDGAILAGPEIPARSKRARRRRPIFAAAARNIFRRATSRSLTRRGISSRRRTP